MRKIDKSNVNKKGVLIEIGAIILIVLTSLGIMAVANYNSSPLYIGDSNSHKYFDYFKCKELVNNITEKNVVIFDSIEKAKQAGYNETFGCI